MLNISNLKQKDAVVALQNAMAGEDEINFTIGSLDDGNIYHFIDTDDSTVDDTQKSNWFTEVQFPIELEE